jgi:methyl-accepting chemotaxis protein
MNRLSSLRLGIKLAAMSALSIVLVLIMMGSQMLTNEDVRNNSDLIRSQEQIARDITEVRRLETRMERNVADIRLARSSEELRKAINSVDKDHTSVIKIIDETEAKLRIPENRERMKKIRALAEQYASDAKSIEAMQEEIIGQIAALTGKEAAFVSTQLAPVGQQLDKLTREATDSAAAYAEKQSVKAKEQLKSAEHISLSIGFVAFAILLGSAVFGALAIGRPLSRITGVMNELTNDRIVDVPYTNRGDEIGDVARATEIFKESIAEKVLNFRVRSALEVVKSNVMIADDNYNIMYMNSTLKATLRDAEADIRQVIPGFESDKLIGASMDVFHKNPAHQRHLLESLTGPYETHIAVGPIKLHLIAIPVIDNHGKRVGTVVEWRNETVDKAIESEVDAMVKAAVAGDFSKRIPLEGKKEFMLLLAKQMNALCDNIASAMTDLAGMLGALADGDLTRRITAEYEGLFGKLQADANAMADRIGATITEIKASTREVTNASAEISASTSDLSQRTEEQAASLEETSASMEEISSTVKMNADNAQQANKSARETQAIADRGGEVVAKAVGAMALIEESSRKVSDIIGVIDEIARQTNLLALNAAVEAARAGDAGRGFAVVASEVRSLAQRSSQAAKDIENLITNSNGQVKEGVDLVNRAGTALNEIVESIKKVTDIVSDIATASIEQATGIEQINKALAQMDEVTQQNSALVEENAATAKTLENQAMAMNERVAFFQVGGEMETARSAGSRLVAAPAKTAKGPMTVRASNPEATAKPVAHTAAVRRGPARNMRSALAVALEEPEWKDF